MAFDYWVGVTQILWVPKTSSGAPTRDDVSERTSVICRAAYVPHSAAPEVRQDPDGDLEILVSNPVGVFGTYRFDPEPRRIEVKMALAGIEREATALRERLAQLSPDQWNLAVKLDGHDVNPHWIARHVVHDATHHLGDVANLRAAL